MNVELNLKVPGKHNISNALAVLTVAKQLKIPDKISIKVLNNFSGTWRRMEFRGKVNGAKIYDDYGHHPTEIKATLEVAREMLSGHCEESRLAGRRGNLIIGDNNFRSPRASGARDDGKNKLWCIFQPHQYQRTYKLFNQFLTAFDAADKTIILPIYSVAGREKESIKKKVSSEKLAMEIGIKNQKLGKKKNIFYMPTFAKAKNYLEKNLKAGDVAIVMGAGDINKLTEMLFKNRKK